MTVSDIRDRRANKKRPLLNRVVQIRFEAADHDKLTEIADNAGLTLSELIRLVIHSAFLKEPDVDELLRADEQEYGWAYDEPDHGDDRP